MLRSGAIGGGRKCRFLSRLCTFYGGVVGPSSCCCCDELHFDLPAFWARIGRSVEIGISEKFRWKFLRERRQIYHNQSHQSGRWGKTVPCSGMQPGKNLICTPSSWRQGKNGDIFDGIKQELFMSSGAVWCYLAGDETKASPWAKVSPLTPWPGGRLRFAFNF